jgi:HSP20 family molecular chaperone IbpA
MKRNWTPKSRVSVTDAGVVIEVELGDIHPNSLQVVSEAQLFFIRGHHELFGDFESRLDIPSGYSGASARARFEHGILRIDWPPDTGSSRSKPLFGDS